MPQCLVWSYSLISLRGVRLLRLEYRLGISCISREVIFGEGTTGVFGFHGAASRPTDFGWADFFLTTYQ